MTGTVPGHGVERVSHEGIEAVRTLLADVVGADQTIEERRAAMSATAGAVPAPDGVRVEVDTLGGRPAEWLAPVDAERATAVLYLHGGGYVIGGLDTHRNLAGRLALSSGVAVVSLDYRLAPEHTFPEPIDDVLAALDDLEARGIAADRIVLAGDSAGGGLALASLGALVAAGRPTPAAAIGFSAWTDLTLTSPSVTSRAEADPMCTAGGLREMAAAYLGDVDPTDPLASPRFTAPDVLAGFPPLHLVVGDDEILLDDTTAMAEAARAAGVEVELAVWPDLIHVFQAFPPELVPESVSSLDAAGAFVARHLAAPVA